MFRCAQSREEVPLRPVASGRLHMGRWNSVAQGLRAAQF
jgi:hypothetical protein